MGQLEVFLRWLCPNSPNTHASRVSLSCRQGQAPSQACSGRPRWSFLRLTSAQAGSLPTANTGTRRFFQLATWAASFSCFAIRVFKAPSRRGRSFPALSPLHVPFSSRIGSGALQRWGRGFCLFSVGRVSCSCVGFLCRALWGFGTSAVDSYLIVAQVLPITCGSCRWQVKRCKLLGGSAGNCVPDNLHTLFLWRSYATASLYLLLAAS